MGLKDLGLVFRVQGWGLGIWDLGCGFQSLGFRA